MGTARVKGQYVTTGLGAGSSDIIGYLPVTITPAMVGKKIAQFVAIEMKDGEEGYKKTKKEHLDEQIRFLAGVERDGGIARLAKTIEDVASM